MARAEASSSSSAPPPLSGMPLPPTANAGPSSIATGNGGDPAVMFDFDNLGNGGGGGGGGDDIAENEAPEARTVFDAASALAHANYNPAVFKNDPIGSPGDNGRQAQAAAAAPRVNAGGNGGGSGGGGGGGWFGKILGGNKNVNGNDSKAAAPLAATAQPVNGPGGGGDSTLPPPPPPPPPPLTSGNNNIGREENDRTEMMSQMAATPPQQRGQQQQPQGNVPWGPQKHQQQQQQKQHQQQQQQHLNPNGNPYNQQQQQQQHPNSNYNVYNQQQMDENAAYYQNLLYELDESTLREMTLTHHVHNLTSLLGTVQSESDVLLARIDVMTERLADSDANFNYVHNRNLELDANCTSLSQLVRQLQKDIESHESSLKDMESDKDEGDKLVNELRAELRKVTSELEKLACLVETERFEGEKSEYLDELHEKQVHKRKKKKKWSFWGWMFGWDSGGGSGGGKDKGTGNVITREQQSMEADERGAGARPYGIVARLQTERANVDKLESTVDTLRRNNTAIADVVSSCDSLVSELNARVAVFEEVKMVLKAALRQLQLDINEEAPKTRLLVEEVKCAKEREEELREDTEMLLEDFEGERRRTRVD